MRVLTVSIFYVVLLAVTASGASPRSLDLNVQRRDSVGTVSCQPLSIDPTPGDVIGALKSTGQYTSLTAGIDEIVNRQAESQEGLPAPIRAGSAVSGGGRRGTYA